ncbi:MAG TPA: hypothetical protein VK608_02135, partial [Edaphobacter sp.]|nr:hypothetical protein [Edaphobacter sp.]
EDVLCRHVRDLFKWIGNLCVMGTVKYRRVGGWKQWGEFRGESGTSGVVHDCAILWSQQHHKSDTLAPGAALWR